MIILIHVQILSGDDTARLILLVHRHLHRARSPRHQRRCLGALKALLALLGDLVCAPHALRHTVHILLQHLRVRSVLYLNICLFDLPQLRHLTESVLYYTHACKRAPHRLPSAEHELQLPGNSRQMSV